MNKHVKAFLIKFVGSFFVLYIILGLIYGMTFGEVFLLSAVLGAVAYLVGDLLILPRTNNLVATLADFVLAGVVIYIFVEGMTATDNAFTISLLATIGVGLVEIIFHRYMQNFVLSNDSNRAKGPVLQYQTEISEELKLKDTNKRDDRKQ